MLAAVNACDESFKAYRTQARYLSPTYLRPTEIGRSLPGCALRDVLTCSVHALGAFS
jgi:hypothetical protein